MMCNFVKDATFEILIPEDGHLQHDTQNIKALHVVCGPHSPRKLTPELWPVLRCCVRRRI